MEDKKLNELRAEYSLAVRTADTIRETIANIRASLVPLEESLDYWQSRAKRIAKEEHEYTEELLNAHEEFTASVPPVSEAALIEHIRRKTQKDPADKRDDSFLFDSSTKPSVITSSEPDEAARLHTLRNDFSDEELPF